MVGSFLPGIPYPSGGASTSPECLRLSAPQNCPIPLTPYTAPGGGTEYRHKTTGPREMWATDASHFRVVGWGFYYLVRVIDDHARSFLAWQVQLGQMTADSLIEVVQRPRPDALECVAVRQCACHLAHRCSPVLRDQHGSRRTSEVVASPPYTYLRIGGGDRVLN